MSETEKPARATRTREAPQPVAIDETMLQRVIAATMEASAARPSPVGLRTFEEIETFCDRVTRSNLCPKEFKGKPDDAIIAVMMGQELGLPAMASLQSIAVVNGRPVLWGDAVPGICMQTGKVEDVREYFDGEPGTDAFAAVCIVTRRGLSPREGRFSAGDVRQAGLKTTHVQYPKDMMMWRARHRAWRGAFPDTLKGMGTAELEQEEANRPVWPMPKPQQSWFSAKPSYDHDMTWLNALAGRLANEPNAWKWLECLADGLKDAPTARDVEEIGNLDMVTVTWQAAPEEAQKTIAAAFDAARARFSVDKSESQQNEKKSTQGQQTPAAVPTNPVAASEPEGGPTPPSGDAALAFEAWLLDEAGDPVEIQVDPVQYAEALKALYDKSQNRVGLLEQNADGMDDAEKASAEAKAILDEFTENEAAEPVPEVRHIGIPTERGQPDWKLYMTWFKAALADVTAPLYLDFIAANWPTLSTAQSATKLHLIGASVKRAKELGIDPPAILQEAPKQEAKPNGAADKDEQIVDNLIGELAPMTDIHSVNGWSGGMTKVATRERLTRNGRTDLVQKMNDAQLGKLAELRASAG
jgi:hypothetical protein